MSKAINVLHQNNISNYNTEKCYLEFQHRNIDQSYSKYNEDFTWHKDDKQIIGCPVYTVIFYLKKDNTVTGGNFAYVIDNKKHEHEVKTKDIICFSGHIEHMPTALKGCGDRNSIVVFIERT